MYYLITIIIGCLLGSIPSAHLLLKDKGIDITKSGTGNVGAMNAYEVSGSRNLGIMVFLIDALKGLLSVYIPLLIFPVNFSLSGIALLSAVMAHCFNPWLSFQGGRGLATAFGGTILISPIIPAIWLITWLIVYLSKKDILIANIAAIFIDMILICIFWESIFKFSYPTPDSASSLILFSWALMIILFVKHIEPLLEILAKRKTKED